MRDSAPKRPLVLTLLVIAAAAVWVVTGFGTSPVTADDGGVLVATSVCEAHELRAAQEENPDLKIEIPKKFDTPWPTREACLSHAAAEDPDTPKGRSSRSSSATSTTPGMYEIECLYCHAGTDRSPAAGVPSVELCMGCHAQFPASYDELEGIRTLKQSTGRTRSRSSGCRSTACPSTSSSSTTGAHPARASTARGVTATSRRYDKLAT